MREDSKYEKWCRGMNGVPCGFWDSGLHMVVVLLAFLVILIYFMEHCE